MNPEGSSLDISSDSRLASLGESRDVVKNVLDWLKEGLLNLNVKFIDFIKFIKIDQGFAFLRDGLALHTSPFLLSTQATLNPWIESYHSLSTYPRYAINTGAALFGLLSFVGVYCIYNYLKIEYLPGYSASRFQQKQKKEGEFSCAKQLRLRVIDLDGALPLQTELIEKFQPQVYDLKEWGPPLRIECWWWTTKGFEQALSYAVGSETDDDIENKPLITFYGSNDFHHVALSLIRRFRQPFNLVLFDNHPDWFRMYPIGLHCGCWFTHAMNLSTVQSAFHFGGNSGEFLDESGWHPWKEMESGKLAVFPALEEWKAFRYRERCKFFEILRAEGYVSKERALKILLPHKEQLQKYPLYITLDKDSMRRADNLQNWNSGELSRTEILNIVEVLIEYSGGNLLALDVTGDYSKVNVCGIYRHHLHETQHAESENSIKQEAATPGNMFTNLAILRTVQKVLGHPQRLDQ